MEGNLITPNETGDMNANNETYSGAENKWIYQLSDDLKTNEFLGTHKTISDLGRETLRLKEVADNSIPKLPENATDEQRATYFTQLGRPESPAAYDFGEISWPEGIDDSIKQMTTSDLNAFRDVFHEIGLTQDQAKRLQAKSHEMTMERLAEVNKAKNDAYEAAVQALKKKWGDKYETNLTLANRGFDKAGELAGIKDEFIGFMIDSGLSNNPLFAQVFHAFGKAIGEDSIEGALGGQGNKTTDVVRGEDGRPILNWGSM